MYYEDNVQTKCLEATQDKKSFLYFIALYFLSYSLMGLLVNYILLHHYNFLKKITNSQDFDAFAFSLLFFSIFIRLISLKKKNLITNYKIFIMIVDIFSYLILNIYFFLLLDGIFQNTSNYYGHYIFMFNYLFTAVIIGYIISIYLSSQRKYDCLLGILLTWTICFVGTVLLTKIYKKLPY